MGEFCHKKSFLDEDNDSAIPQVRMYKIEIQNHFMETTANMVENRNSEAYISLSPHT